MSLGCLKRRTVSKKKPSLISRLEQNTMSLLFFFLKQEYPKIGLVLGIIVSKICNFLAFLFGSDQQGYHIHPSNLRINSSILFCFSDFPWPNFWQYVYCEFSFFRILFLCFQMSVSHNGVLISMG